MFILIFLPNLYCTSRLFNNLNCLADKRCLKLIKSQISSSTDTKMELDISKRYNTKRPEKFQTINYNMNVSIEKKYFKFSLLDKINKEFQKDDDGSTKNNLIFTSMKENSHKKIITKTNIFCISDIKSGRSSNQSTEEKSDQVRTKDRDVIIELENGSKYLLEDAVVVKNDNSKGKQHLTLQDGTEIDVNKNNLDILFNNNDDVKIHNVNRVEPRDNNYYLVLENGEEILVKDAKNIKEEGDGVYNINTKENTVIQNSADKKDSKNSKNNKKDKKNNKKKSNAKNGVVSCSCSILGVILLSNLILGM